MIKIDENSGPEIGFEKDMSIKSITLPPLRVIQRQWDEHGPIGHDSRKGEENVPIVVHVRKEQDQPKE